MNKATNQWEYDDEHVVAERGYDEWRHLRISQTVIEGPLHLLLVRTYGQKMDAEHVEGLVELELDQEADLCDVLMARRALRELRESAPK